MNKVNAIIMAAGKGERLRPITLTTPKPLIKINGTPMIENLISSLRKRGIEDITIVTGYLKEKLEYLKEKYGVNIINNPDYEIANNISSLYYAKEKLGNTIIMDGDQIINDISIIKTDFTRSGYTCIINGNEFVNEWILELDEDSKIISCARTGATNGYILKSLSFWTSEDSEKLRKYLSFDYKKQKKSNIYWDDVAMFGHRDDFELYGYVIDKNSIIEIDSLDELKEIDSSYKEA